MSLLNILAGLLQGDAVEILLVGLAEVDGHLVDGGENHQHVGLDVESQLGACAVLVDHGCHALIVSGAILHHGDAATTHGDNYCVQVDELLHHG